MLKKLCCTPKDQNTANKKKTTFMITVAPQHPDIIFTSTRSLLKFKGTFSKKVHGHLQDSRALCRKKVHGHFWNSRALFGCSRALHWHFSKKIFTCFFFFGKCFENVHGHFCDIYVEKRQWGCLDCQTALVSQASPGLSWVAELLGAEDVLDWGGSPLDIPWL